MGTPRRTDFDVDDLVERYLAGESVKKLAAAHGFSRQVVYRVLRDRGITPRNRSQAMYVRMASMSEDEKKRITHAAHVARSERGASASELANRAASRSRRIGKFEKEFIDLLDSRHIPTDPQEPFLSYNLDVGCGPIAVEVHTQCASPLTSKCVKKLVDCLEAGKSMLYVWIRPGGCPSPECYEKVVSIVEEARRDPSPVSQYWVVRSTGEVYASGCINGDGLSDV